MTRRVREGGKAAMWMVALVALAAAILSGCGGAAGSDPVNVQDPGAGDPGTPSTPSTPSPALAVAFADALPGDTFTPATSATIDATEALYVVADWRQVPADQSARVVIRSPEGSVYLDQVLSLADGTAGLASVSSATTGDRRLVLKLQVWGTTIESYRRTGVWQASVSLVGGDLSGAAQLDLQ